MEGTAPHRAAAETEGRINPAIRTGTRVLVVEDESLLAMMLADMLEELGCKVVGPVGTLSRAMQLIAEGEAIDLALLDINLGGATVFDVADALALRAVPYIFVSGYSTGGMDGRHGAAPVLGKPFPPALLARTIGEVLAASPREARP